nr:MAG TPA: hypothetical protein [Caudoviricetes sp.]
MTCPSSTPHSMSCGGDVFQSRVMLVIEYCHSTQKLHTT